MSEKAAPNCYRPELSFLQISEHILLRNTRGRDEIVVRHSHVLRRSVAIGSLLKVGGGGANSAGEIDGKRRGKRRNEERQM